MSVIERCPQRRATVDCPGNCPGIEVKFSGNIE
jgi:hypothetical protein